MTTREPLLSPVPIAELRPTQVTVGLREVREKRREWRARGGEDGAEFLGRHMIPVLKGPKGRLHVIDHHHLVRALLEAGVEHVLTNVVADLSALGKHEFWVFCDNRGWCHPYDGAGRRVGFDAIPRSIADLAVADMPDDPYRSLAGAVRRAGGFAKDTTPFSEFIWADFLRRRVKRRTVDDDFTAAAAEALSLARSPEAGHLPGWCGPSPPSPEAHAG